ncbi:MAG: 5-formyltetrahydrofolate cyclo-ligase [Rikenellaceae bacterium]
MTKDQIRTLMRSANLNKELSHREFAAQKVFDIIEQSTYFATSHTIALFASLPDEIPSCGAIERWYEMGKRVVLPRIEGDGVMNFYLYSPETLAKGSFGISEPKSGVSTFIEPSQIELMVVPGVAFCLDGKRLGRGRGFYDRYLSQEGFSAHTIGVGYSHQLLNSIPFEPHDITLDEVITDVESTHNRAEGLRQTTISAIVLSAVEAAGVDASRLGMGVERLNQGGRSWVLLNYSMELCVAPKMGEKIEIETWINGCSRATSTRNFVLRNGTGEPIGEVSTLWCMIDLNTRRAVNLTSEEVNYGQYVEDRPIYIKVVRRLPEMEDEVETKESRHITNEHDIDFNNHVNTIRYIDMMVAMLPSDRQGIIAPMRLDLQFQSESRLGDELIIKKQERPLTDGKQSLFEIVRSDGSTSVRALFRWY